MKLMRFALIIVLASLVLVGVARADYPAPQSITSLTFNNISVEAVEKTVTLGSGQTLLPIVGFVNPANIGYVILSFQGTTIAWPVQVDPNGEFLTNMPIPDGLAPGTYTLTISGVAAASVVVPG